MKRLGLAVAVVVAVVVVAPAVAWAGAVPICNGQSCDSGWYTSSVTVTWDLNGGSNAGGCAPQAYNQDTNQSSLQGSTNLPPWTYCITNVPGGSDTRYFFIRLETSSPTATVAPSRPPDSGGWYNHPVAGTVSANSFSGIASCTSPTYSGPSSGAAALSVTCSDYAGKRVTAASAPFAFDITPPSLSAAAYPGDQSVALSWQTGGDIAPTAAIRVTRRRAGAHDATATVYRGSDGGYVDNHVRNGVRYTYTITAWDQAGNASSRTVEVTPGPRLLGPAGGARVNAPPMLSWTPVRGATYYNVQLYRHGKVLSLWPKHASLQLRREWKFDGRRYHLKPGRYRWYVWPGFGRRSAGRYGGVIGQGMFIVVR